MLPATTNNNDKSRIIVVVIFFFLNEWSIFMIIEKTNCISDVLAMASIKFTIKIENII
jgi:hypothetical protein